MRGDKVQFRQAWPMVQDMAGYKGSFNLDVGGWPSYLRDCDPAWAGSGSFGGDWWVDRAADRSQVRGAARGQSMNLLRSRPLSTIWCLVFTLIALLVWTKNICIG